MKNFVQPNATTHHRLVLRAGLLLLVASLPTTAGAQQTAVDNQSLSAQLRTLQAKVAKLEAALEQKHAGEMNLKMQGGPMVGRMGKGMKKKDGMNMGPMAGQGMADMKMAGMKIKSAKKKKMSGQGMGGMGMMGGGGMAMMGQMKGMGSMQMPSALPGFAGASHIYHIGSTNFFLDHPQHITLTQEQQTKLNQIKQKSLAGQATLDRWIAEAEQELWMLTSAEAPDAAKIEAKVRETGKLRGDKRIAFIRAVGEAAQVLTDEQRQTLVGILPPEHKAAGVNE